MSRSVARVLLCLVVGFVSAISFAEAADGPVLKVSVFRCDVTTPLGSPIYSGYEPLATVEHPLLAKGIVLDDGRGRYVLCAVDYCELCNSTHTMFRRKLADAVGTDISRVAVQTIHQHTAPMADADAYRLLLKANNPPVLLDPEFYNRASDRLAEAAKKSLGQLEPFDRVGTGQVKVDRVASSRRVKAPDGSIIVRWSSCTDPKLRAMPEGYIDPFVKTITFARGDKPLVRLHYYARIRRVFTAIPGRVTTCLESPGKGWNARRECRKYTSTVAAATSRLASTTTAPRRLGPSWPNGCSRG